MPTPEAARTVVGAGVAQLQANEEGVLASPDPEFVHQARVALRRMRSALRMFRREIGETRANAWHDALGETSRALGDARDWDVFGSHTLPAVLEAFGDAALARSLRARVAYRRRTERAKASASDAIAALRRGVARARALARACRRRNGATAGRNAAGIRRARDAQAPQATPRGRADARRSLPRRAPPRARRTRSAFATVSTPSRPLFKPRPLTTFSASLESMQDALGDCNDAATATAPAGRAASARTLRGLRARLVRGTRARRTVARSSPSWRRSPEIDVRGSRWHRRNTYVRVRGDRPQARQERVQARGAEAAPAPARPAVPAARAGEVPGASSW